MNDQSNNAARTAPEPQDEDFTSDQAIENAALAGAAAIQRLVAERNNLRNRLAAQQRELAAMRVFNEELRRRLYVIHQRYVEVPSGSSASWSSSTAAFARSFRRDITARAKGRSRGKSRNRRPRPPWCGASPKPKRPSNLKVRATCPKRPPLKPARAKRDPSERLSGHAHHEAPGLRNGRNRP